MTKLHVRALCAAMLAGAAVFSCASAALADASADDAASNTFRLGSYTVFYHTSASDLSGPYVPAGVDLNLRTENLETLYIAYIRRLSSHFDVELTAGYPPLSKTVGVGPASLGSVPYNGQEISTARWLAPTLLLEYRFLSENSPWQPYVGAGVNHTSFYDRDFTAAGDAAAGGRTKLSLTSSTGPAGTAGFVYKFAPHWQFDASYSIARVRTHLSADTAGEIRTTDISFGPQALVVAVGYSF